MPNLNHVFTLEDVFNQKFPESDMRKLLAHVGDTSMPLRSQITLGDVALQSGTTEAWWCTRILPSAVRCDVIRAALPSFKRAIDRNPNHLNDSQWYLMSIDILEKYSKGESVSFSDLMKDLNAFLKKPPKSQLKEALEYLMFIMFKMDYTEDLLTAMRILDKHLTDLERDQQIDDICVVFTPLVGVRLKQVSN